MVWATAHDNRAGIVSQDIQGMKKRALKISASMADSPSILNTSKNKVQPSSLPNPVNQEPFRDKCVRADIQASIRHLFPHLSHSFQAAMVQVRPWYGGVCHKTQNSGCGKEFPVFWEVMLKRFY